MTPDALPLPRTLDDWAEHHADAIPGDEGILWQTTVPSLTRPGVTYTVKAMLDGTWSCDCPARQYKHFCRHIEAGVYLLEGKKPSPKPKESKKLYAMKEYITGRRQHRNSMITWHDPEFQAMLPESQHDVLEAIIKYPGMTRQDLERVLPMRINGICGRVRELLDMELLTEDGCRVPESTGKPRARLYPNYEMLIVEKGA